MAVSSPSESTPAACQTPRRRALVLLVMVAMVRHSSVTCATSQLRFGRSGGDLAASRSQHHSSRAKPREPLRSDKTEAAGTAGDDLERPRVVAALAPTRPERRNGTVQTARPASCHSARSHRGATTGRSSQDAGHASRPELSASSHAGPHHEHPRRLQHADVLLFGAAAICGQQDDRRNTRAVLQAGGGGIRDGGEGPDAAHSITFEREPKRGVQLGRLGPLGRGRPRELVHMAAPTARLEEAGLKRAHLTAVDLHDELTVAVVDGGERRLGLGRREVVAPHRGRLPKVGVEHFVRFDGRGKVRPAKHVLRPTGRSRDVELRHERARLIARVEPGTASHHLGAVGGAAARKRWRLLAGVHLVESAPHPRLLDGLKLVLIVVADGRVELVLVRDVGRARDGALDVERNDLVGARLEDADAHLSVDRLGGALVVVGGDGQHVGPAVEGQLLADLDCVVVKEAEGLEHGLVDAKRLSLGERRHDLSHEDNVRSAGDEGHEPDLVAAVELEFFWPHLSIPNKRVVVGCGCRPEMLGHCGVSLLAPQVLLARKAHASRRVDVALDRQGRLQGCGRTSTADLQSTRLEPVDAYATIASCPLTYKRGIHRMNALPPYH
eukprot:scaffold9921_cov112-Isochrysis_galbana.AAC.8